MAGEGSRLVSVEGAGFGGRCFPVLGVCWVVWLCLQSPASSVLASWSLGMQALSPVSVLGTSSQAGCHGVMQCATAPAQLTPISSSVAAPSGSGKGAQRHCQQLVGPGQGAPEGSSGDVSNGPDLKMYLVSSNPLSLGYLYFKGTLDLCISLAHGTQRNWFWELEEVREQSAGPPTLLGTPVLKGLF